MSKLLEKFKNISKTNKFGHAYLIYDTDYDNIYSDLNEIITKYFIKENIDINNDMNVFIIECEKSNIIKDQIIELQNSISTKSQFSENVIYIIKECDKLNDYSANALLKTLEEPENNIYAFLITNNLEKVKTTIKSRCILIKINDKSLVLTDNYSKEIIDNAIEIIKLFEDNIYENEANIYKHFKDMTREEIIDFFTIMNFYYKDCLNKIDEKKIEYFVGFEEDICVDSKKKLINKILLLNTEIKKLYYNININLFLDSFIIKYERC